MTKTTNEPIMCECGHAANQHGDGLKINCWHQVNGRMDCKCQKTRVQVYASRLSTLEAAVEEQTKTNRRMQTALEKIKFLSGDHRIISEWANWGLTETAPKVQP